MDLSSNQLTGEIPAQLGRLYQLQALDLSNNQLKGPIPVELGQLGQSHPHLSSSLRELHLQHNQLTGAIPAELGQLSQLREFSSRGNRLAGFIPQELEHLPDVYVLNLAANWVGSSRIKVTWDDPGDPTARYEYRLWDPIQTWTDWAEIEDPETSLRADEEGTIEWTLTVLPTSSGDRFRIVHTYIGVRVSNSKGPSPEAVARLESSDATDQRPVYVPYCRNQLSLWDGTACTTTAILPHVFMGPFGGSIAESEIIVTNRDPSYPACEVALLFHQGTSEAPEVSFNDPLGQVIGQNLLRTVLSRGGAQIVTLRPAHAKQLVIGAVWVFVRSPCSVDSLQVQEGPQQPDSLQPVLKGTSAPPPV